MPLAPKRRVTRAASLVVGGPSEDYLWLCCRQARRPLWPWHCAAKRPRVREVFWKPGRLGHPPASQPTPHVGGGRALIGRWGQRFRPGAKAGQGASARIRPRPSHRPAGPPCNLSWPRASCPRLEVPSAHPRRLSHPPSPRRLRARSRESPSHACCCPESRPFVQERVCCPRPRHGPAGNLRRHVVWAQ